MKNRMGIPAGHAFRYAISKSIKKVCILFLMMLGAQITFAASNYQLSSPNGHIKMEISIGGDIHFNVWMGDELIVENCTINMQVGQDNLGVSPKVKKVHRQEIDEQIRAVVPLKNAVTPNHAHSLTLEFAGNYGVEFRAYDNGIAYRFVLNKKSTVDVSNEGMRLQFPENFVAHISKTQGFVTSYENPYTHMKISDYQATDEMSYLPVLLESPKGTKALLSESDVRDYPAMFVKSTGGNGLMAVFPKCPEEWVPYGDRSQQITKECGYIARTSGKRTMPWRFAVIGNDADIAANEMERILSGKCELTDTSWIKSGKVSWDWWNHWTVWNVDFQVGINNDTYKYFIDFASKYGIEYILLDEGWTKDVRDPYTTRDEIDIKELVEYGRSKNVDVFLWPTWLPVREHFVLIKYNADMGVAGLKVDFMDHSDQWMVNYYERVTRECAKNHLLVDFHGSFKPAGLEHRYPNLLSYEGVRGMEQGGGCVPSNSIWLPFIRNAVGAMDFTPGSMASVQPEYNYGTGVNPMGSGTRAYQMALYVVFESGLQMLADSPTRYMREEDCTRFIASVPVTWDETRVLAAKAGDYIVVAKRKGERWYIGAITGENPQDINIELDFLKKKGELICFKDGANAHRIAVDYKCEKQEVTPTTTLRLQLARNGGWCGIISR